eukprot:15458803-Alexandrium_andersonii.AAC.1
MQHGAIASCPSCPSPLPVQSALCTPPAVHGPVGGPRGSRSEVPARRLPSSPWQPRGPPPIGRR